MHDRYHSEATLGWSVDRPMRRFDPKIAKQATPMRKTCGETHAIDDGANNTDQPRHTAKSIHICLILLNQHDRSWP